MGFEGFAALSRDDLMLFLNEPGKGSAGRAGGNPEPGGWDRLQIAVQGLNASVAELRAKGAVFRGEEAQGQEAWQILLADPSGNVVELFERSAD